MATLDDLYNLELVNGSAVRDTLQRIETLLGAHGGAGAAGGGGGAGAPGAGSFLSGLTTGPARILAMFAALERGLTTLGGAVAKFVSHASPAHILRWNLAIADLQAVIGRALIPVMEKATAMVRKLADTFASLSPEAQKLAAGLGVGSGLGAALGALVTAGTAFVRVFGGVPVLIGTLVGALAGVLTTMDSGKAIMESFGGALKAVASLFEAIAMAIMPIIESGLVPALKAFAEVIGTVADGVKSLVNGVRGMFGLKPLEDKSSVGAAVRPAQIGDIQSFINRAYTNAFQGPAGRNIEQEQLTELSAIRKILERGNPLVTPADSWASARPGAERLGGWLGGDEGRRIGRGTGAVLDTASAPFTAAPRAIVATLRTLFE